ETDALARHRTDQPLLLAAVADRLARRVDVRGKGRICHLPPVPEGCEQVVLADDPLAVLHEKGEEVEDLGRDGDRLVAAAPLPRVRIKRMTGKEELHRNLREDGVLSIKKQGFLTQKQRPGQSLSPRLPLSPARLGETSAGPAAVHSTRPPAASPDDLQ